MIDIAYEIITKTDEELGHLNCTILKKLSENSIIFLVTDLFLVKQLHDLSYVRKKWNSGDLLLWQNHHLVNVMKNEIINMSSQLDAPVYFDKQLCCWKYINQIA